MAHILIADDDPDVRKSIARLLERQGHTYSEAEDVIGVWDALESEALERFNLIVLDYNFDGGMNGLDIMRQLGPECCAHRILMLTGHRDPDIKAEAEEMGAIGFCLKPIDHASLAAAIEGALRAQAKLAR